MILAGVSKVISFEHWYFSINNFTLLNHISYNMEIIIQKFWYSNMTTIQSPELSTVVLFIFIDSLQTKTLKVIKNDHFIFIKILHFFHYY